MSLDDFGYPPSHSETWQCEYTRRLEDALRKDHRYPRPGLSYYGEEMGIQNARKEAYSELRRTIANLEKDNRRLTVSCSAMRESSKTHAAALKKMETAMEAAVAKAKADHAEELAMMNRTLELRLQYISALEEKLNA